MLAIVEKALFSKLTQHNTTQQSEATGPSGTVTLTWANAAKFTCFTRKTASQPSTYELGENKQKKQALMVRLDPPVRPVCPRCYWRVWLTPSPWRTGLADCFSVACCWFCHTDLLTVCGSGKKNNIIWSKGQSNRRQSSVWDFGNSSMTVMKLRNYPDQWKARHSWLKSLNKCSMTRFSPSEDSVCYQWTSAAWTFPVRIWVRALLMFYRPAICVCWTLVCLFLFLFRHWCTVSLCVKVELIIRRV